jgi:hypothetical protein
MFLFHAVLEKPDQQYQDALRRMARYLWALAGSGELPFLGDDDGGRLFHPFGERSRFARATLAACAAFTGDTPSHGDVRDLDEMAVWWLGDRAVCRAPALRSSELFRESGVATMVEQDTEITAAVRAFGSGAAGHSHAHSLHFILRNAGQAVLIDPGTYTYVSDPVWRDRFRGTAAHNTIRVDGRDQADPAGPFRWSKTACSEILDWQASPWALRARCRYRGLVHERRIFFSRGAICVVDDISGAGRHRIEQFWHPAGPVERLAGWIGLPGGVRLMIPEMETIEIGEDGEYGWRSPAPNIKLSCPVLRISVDAELPYRLIAVFDTCSDNSVLRVEAGRLILGERQIAL